jgi:putative ubiquitin-RnfH superfamily antitoxin RatB of RatAB toxin-antitoxin module
MGRDESVLVVEVVYAEPHRQLLCSVALPRGSTIQDAIEQSGIARRLTGSDLAGCKVGVFGRVRTRDTPLRHGDRVEIYRPLLVDPKDARRARSRRSRQAGG